MTKILDGKALSQTIATNLAKQVAQANQSRASNKPIKLVIIQIGDLPASSKYIEKKKDFATKLGIIVEHKRYPAINSSNATRAKAEVEQITRDITTFNADQTVHGVMVQLPIPNTTETGGDSSVKADSLTTNTILNTIAPNKDVDGLTATSMKQLFDGRTSEGFIPATTRGIITMLEHYGIDLTGKKISMIGQSALVGRPTALALLNRRATVTICNRATTNLDKITRQSDIIIVAAGHPNLITANHVSTTQPDQIIIDVGINIIPNDDMKAVNKDKITKIVGDVDFPAVSPLVSAISPVPGGVGPMTIVSLFQNLVDAYFNNTLNLNKKALEKLNQKA